MNKKRMIYNVATNALFQIVLALSGFILPRFILMYYGSSTNGLIASISQFLGYAALVEMGIENATLIALYKPIALNNYKAVDIILTSCKKMYSTSGFLYIVIAVGISLVYPFMIKNQISYFFALFMVIILASSGMIDYFILGKYKVLLIADQRYYIINLARSVATVCMCVGSVWLLLYNYSLLLVKSMAVISHLGATAFIVLYVKRKYSAINFKSNTTYKIKQRWNSMLHQISATITYNTDLVVLAICLPGSSLKEISVYTVYAMVVALVGNIVSMLTTGMNASFGALFAKDEKEEIRRGYDQFEYVYYVFLFFLYTCFMVLIFSFVSCYTRGITDVEYIRYEIGILFALNGLMSRIKEPSGVMINAVGHFRETQRYSVGEALINIVLSLILVWKLGIIGVLIGTLISHTYMSVHFVYYVFKKLMVHNLTKSVWRILRNVVFAFLVITLEMRLIKITVEWRWWLVQAITISIINGLLFIGLNGLCEKDIMKKILNRIKKRGNKSW